MNKTDKLFNISVFGPILKNYADNYCYFCLKPNTNNMPIGVVPFDSESTRQELDDGGYLILDSSTTDIHALSNREPMILDAGVILFVCMGGEGKIVVDMTTLHIRRGSFVLLLPYSVIQIVEASEDIEITLTVTGFGFLDKFTIMQPVENYVAQIMENPCLQLNERQLEEVRNIYDFVERQHANARGPLAHEIQSSLMTFLSLRIISLYAVQQPAVKQKLSRHEQIFRNFTISLAKNFRERRTVEFYAQEACLTPKHFSAVIKQRSGKLPMEWIAERTIILVRFLLDNSDMSIQEIANELNFPNQSFFTRYFKTRTGMTPTAYRAREL